MVIDNYKCGYQATRHLFEQGCKRVGLITASLKRNVYARRYRGYVDAHFDAKVPLDERLVMIKDLSEESAVEAALEILDIDEQERPDGLFITNDFVAAVCMQKLKEHGVRIPQDMAVVGFNNDVISRVVEPHLSTIDYPGRDMGEIAARNLVNHLKGLSDIRQTSTIIVRSELLIRQSSLRRP